MNPEYIIVQAGGKGSRMEQLTSNKPKALVPINNLPMIFHLFKKYPEKKYIIISDYKIDVMRKYLEAFAPVKYLVVSAEGKKGTCSGIRTSINLIPDHEPFMLIWSDLILPEEFEFPIELDDYVGLSQDFSCRWRYMKQLFEEIPSQDSGVAGLFLFQNKDKLQNVPEEGELVKWMQNQKQIYKVLELSRTKEYGLFSEWNKLSEHQTGSRCRPFNKLIVNGERIVKEGIDEQGKALAVREQNWYKEVSNRGYKKIPYIYSYEPFQMQRINGCNIFEYELTVEQQKIILKKLVDSLRELHNLGSAPVDYFSIYDAYIGKTFKRLEKIRNVVPFGEQKFIDINGRKCRNIYFYKDLLRKKIDSYECASFQLLHGDNTFSNMMLDKNMNPVLIDPRGYFGYTDLYGDAAYDWAKLYYSIKGNYDQFNLKKFVLDIKEDSVNLSIQSNGWENMEQYFFDLIGNEATEEIVKTIHAIIWLSLTTYAWEDYDSICGAFYNGLYYLEEVL